MERNIIIVNESGSIIMPENIASIWMSEAELVELFGVIAPTLRAAIRAIYKSGALKELLLSAKHSDLKFDLLICRTADYIHVYPHVYRRKNCLLSRNQANWGTFQST